MRRFIVDSKIFNSVPNLTIGAIIVNGIDNNIVIDLSKDFDLISETIRYKFDGVELSEYPVVRAWRDVYKSFGEKKNRSSIEALIRRIVNGKELPNINPLVDINNLISLKYEMPCGGEDLNCVHGDIELTYSKGSEVFIPLGSSESENPNDGEIIYKFGNNVICRSFNYRESDLTKLTEQTTSSILVIESLDLDIGKLNDALKELAELISKHLGGDARIVILDKSKNSAVI